jgi:phosphoribosylformylglycinamidine cyclo-ligase
MEALYHGTRRACDLAECTWGPGETPELKGIIYRDTAVLSGAVMGSTFSPEWFDPGNIQPGDLIYGCESSGVHANGLTRCREIAEYRDPFVRRLLHFLIPKQFPLKELSEGYLAELADGRWYGDALLDPTHIYAPIVTECISRKIRVRYAVNITGHGWRKFMRAPKELGYIITVLPTERPIFAFIQEHTELSDEQMYASYNMGLGFALYVAPEDEARFDAMVAENGFLFRVYKAGHIEAGEKRVVIEPKGIEFKGDSLNIR